MTEQEFSTQANRLSEVYGAKNYPKERLKQIAIWAREIEAGLFEAIVDKLIAEQQYPPMLTKFIEAYAELKTKTRFQDLRVGFDCVYCEDSGFILSKDVLPTAYRCKCASGLAKPKYIALWKGPFERISPHPSEYLRYEPISKTEMNKILTKA